MILKRTSSGDQDFRLMVDQLDDYLADVDGEEHSYYAQFNGLDAIDNVVVAYEDDEPVGCGAFKRYKNEIAEIKRMFVRPEFRGRRIGHAVLTELESWAQEQGFTSCILETGHKQEAAVRLYQNCGYMLVPNYDQYAGIDNSICMEKKIAEHQSRTLAS
jgi:putative acetyltransferase